MIRAHLHALAVDTFTANRYGAAGIDSRP
jgi:hypothetical protein